jgi:hypothetical protein
VATLGAIRTRARETLLEASASFWADDELLNHALDGVYDLWGAILDLHQEHFLTNDESNVSLAADATSLTGVPTDVFRVTTLEVRDLTSAASVQGLSFEPRDFNHADFQAARGLRAQDPNGCTVYFCLINAGAPVAAPSILVAPKLSAAVNLRLVYNPTFGALTASDDNPIPGYSDKALFAYIVAYARAKEREDRSPDPEWLAIYATEKKNLLTRLTPRQTQEPDVAEGLFELYY